MGVHAPPRSAAGPPLGLRLLAHASDDGRAEPSVGERRAFGTEGHMPRRPRGAGDRGEDGGAQMRLPFGLSLDFSWTHCDGESSRTSMLLCARHPRDSITWT